MGVHRNIDYNKYPEQGPHLGKRVMVGFNYNTRDEIPGKIVRYDYEEPGHTIIALEDGRILMGTECQFRFMLDSK